METLVVCSRRAAGSAGPERRGAPEGQNKEKRRFPAWGTLSETLNHEVGSVELINQLAPDGPSSSLCEEPFDKFHWPL